MKESILGYWICADTLGICVDSIMNRLGRVGDGRAAVCSWLACLNPHSYAVASQDIDFASALRNADWLIPDGVGVVWASRFLGGQVRGRLTGSDIFYGLQQRMNDQEGMSVFFLGSSTQTLREIRIRMSRDYPRIRVAGTYSPPFKSIYSAAELDDMIFAINATRPDVLWVGMTAPKQEKWIFENRGRLDVRFAAAIGAVFDFYTGNVKRSRPIFQRLGLEWLPRLVQQPRRLWRRMFVSAPIFVWHTVKARWSATLRSSNEDLGK
jgi:N-acetylglucosaminyldiphosphoundecaprenol N-acetyl-beta-D-mannosaminyltransferase